MLRSIGLGCMRLSTEPDRDEARATDVLRAAFDAGITLLDTADAYSHDETERGHNERLIARAIATWSGDRSAIRIATKGGMVRPGGRWEHDGRAKHLSEACQASLTALAVDRIHLYHLHAPDPRVPFATSVRALAALKRTGLVGAIGLCNVTVGQIEEARRIVEIDSVPEIAAGSQTHEGARAVLARMNELLQIDVEVEYCSHAAGPPRCWCRKPLPGLAVLLVQRHRLAPAQCLYVGSGPQDPGFARRLGFGYVEAEDFFSNQP